MFSPLFPIIPLLPSYDIRIFFVYSGYASQAPRSHILFTSPHLRWLSTTTPIVSEVLPVYFHGFPRWLRIALPGLPRCIPKIAPLWLRRSPPLLSNPYTMLPAPFPLLSCLLIVSLPGLEPRISRSQANRINHYTTPYAVENVKSYHIGSSPNSVKCPTASFQSRVDRVSVIRILVAVNKKVAEWCQYSK